MSSEQGWRADAGERPARSSKRSAVARIAIATLPALILLAGLAPSALAAPSGEISGKVTNASAPHDPIEGIEVCAFSMSSEAQEEEAEGNYGCAKTGSGGEYTIAKLGAGNFAVVFGSPEALSGPPASALNYVTQYYKDEDPPSEPTPVKVTGASTTKEIDAELLEGSEISGRITNAATGAPVEGAFACALRSVGSGGIEAIVCARSGANGEYTLTGIPDGSVEVGFIGPELATEYYPDKTSFAEGTALTISAAKEAKSGIDAHMQPRPAPTTPGGEPAPLPGTGAPGAKLPGVGVPLAAPKLAVSLASQRLAVKRNGIALAKLSCVGSSGCHGRLVLSIKRTVRHGHSILVQAITIGTIGYTLRAGETATVRIKLTSAARRLLSLRHGHLAGRLAISQLEPAPSRVEFKSVVLIR